jgi:hypothetical protein
MRSNHVQAWNSGGTSLSAALDGDTGAIAGVSVATGSLAATGAVSCGTLDVSGATTHNASVSLMGAASNLLVDGWVVTQAGGRVLLRDVAGLDQIQLDPTGAVTARTNGTQAWIGGLSDSRLKTAVTSIDPAVASADICALRLVSYDYTAEAAAAMGNTGRHTGWWGFLAQEYDTAMGTLPEDYVYSTIGLQAPAGEEPYRTLDTGRAAYALYGAHKHAIARLDEHAALIAAQAAQIAALTARLDAGGL